MRPGLGGSGDPSPPPPWVGALAWRTFEAAFHPWRARRLEGIHLAGLPDSLPPGTPVLVVANHTSWWDGFLVREVHRRLRPQAPFYTLMLTEQMRHNRILRWLGARGFTPGSTASLRGLLRWLDERRREDPEGLFLFFPQGALWPWERRPLGFARGLEGVARALGPVTILPLGIAFSMGAAPAPRAFLHAGPALPDGSPAAAVEAAVVAQLDLIQAHLHLEGEAAAARWPLHPTGRLSPTNAPPDPTGTGGTPPGPPGESGTRNPGPSGGAPAVP